MPIPISLNRPKLASTVTVAENIDFDTPVIPGDDLNAIELRVFIDGVTIDPFLIVDLAANPIAWIVGGSTLTGVAGDFSGVKIGDVISSTAGGDFAATQTVTNVSVDESVVTFAPVADGVLDLGNAGATLTFTPGDIDSTAYIIRLKHNISGSNLTISPVVYCMDGSQVVEGASADDSDNATIAEAAVTKTLPTSTINLDTFLSNARVARVN